MKPSSSYKPSYIVIESQNVRTVFLNRKTLYSYSDLGDAFKIDTRKYAFQSQMKIFERMNLIKSISITTANRNIRFLEIEIFQEIVNNGLEKEIKKQNIDRENAKKTLDLIDQYVVKLGKEREIV